MAFDYTIDYAQRAIDLAKAGAADHLIVAALADREKKIKDLGLTSAQAGSTPALKEYISMISGAGKVTQPAAAAPPANKLDYSNSTMGDIDFNSDSFGFNPGSYTSSAAAAGSSSLNLGTVMGYVIVGLVGIVILDKVIG